jgi:hypothetical protein
MPYKISGELSDTARIIIIKESNWAAETNSNESSGAYEIDSLDSGTKLVVARKSDGEILSYSGVTGEYYQLDRGIYGGGCVGASTRVNTIDYIEISVTSNATNFGDLTQSREQLGACSNSSSDRGVFASGYTG